VTTGWVLHVDLDQFIAAVEVLRHPELRGKPVIVGGDGDPTKRGVVSTASYEARELGVTSGMPLRTAAKKAPDAVFMAVDKEAYEAVSVEVMAVLREFSPLVEVLGWDEAFLAVESPDPESVARAIQERVLAVTDLHCTVGIGQNKIQAKLATGFGKPAGVFRITNDTWFEILGERSTDALWGIGSKTAKKLAEHGVKTVWELARADYRELAKHFGPTTGPWLVWLARGKDTSPVVGTPYIPRSRSREITFQRNLKDWDEVREEIVRLAGQVVLDVQAEERPVVRVVVKVRYAPFITKTHGQPLAEPTMDPVAIEEGALAALERFSERDPVRLLGVRAEFTPVEES
jgi:nucleotidyltransferase/DNA polymerase involved in DNA repair